MLFTTRVRLASAPGTGPEDKGNQGDMKSRPGKAFPIGFAWAAGAQ